MGIISGGVSLGRFGISTLADRESLRLLIFDAGRESWGVAVVLTSIPGVSLILLLVLLSLLWNDGISFCCPVCTERRADRIDTKTGVRARGYK